MQGKFMIMSPRSLRFHALAVTCAALLSACGGGGDDDDSGDSTQALQAKKALARGYGGFRSADEVGFGITDQLLTIIFAIPGGGSATATYTCVGGTGTLVFGYTDQDGSGTLTTGDTATATLNGCAVGNLVAATGQVSLSVQEATNAANFYLNDQAGSLDLLLTLGNLAFTSVGATYNGSYRLDQSAATAGGAVTEDVTLAAMAVSATSGANASYTNVTARNVYTSTTTTTNAFSGTVDTTIAGLGNVQYTLSLPQPITATGGEFRMTSSTQTLTLLLGSGNPVAIDVDNGKNGSVDLEVDSTLTELGSLVFTL
ncbi:hypothetical protein [Caldimonas sp. KR1-144]|uniref:hypothetical protein n=1 Tax=Caldimonas sp. KR1-144 TaxID=3400911 RepID=UPI003C10FD86